jgi:hypothetical protein
VNSYLIRGEEPTVIDTGITPEIPEFDVALRDLIDPNEIRWSSSHTPIVTTSGPSLDYSWKRRTRRS